MHQRITFARFSALQRAEIAEIFLVLTWPRTVAAGFSALQRAEIAEIFKRVGRKLRLSCFSALQRAEIAEMSLIHFGARKTHMFQCSSTSRNC